MSSESKVSSKSLAFLAMLLPLLILFYTNQNIKISQIKNILFYGMIKLTAKHPLSLYIVFLVMSTPYNLCFSRIHNILSNIKLYVIENLLVK